MVPPAKEGNCVSAQFVWGRKKGSCTSRGAQFYWSFTHEGTEYCLYDCVLLFEKDDILPHIGKLIKIYESADKQKKVVVLWFLRPMEVKKHLRNAIPLENELFLASGQGNGVTGLVPLVAVAGKCDVLCISKDKRNPRPSNVEQREADYIFYRTFDVGNCRISEKIDEAIAGVKAEFLLNRKKQKLDSVIPIDPGKSGLSASHSVDKSLSVRGVPVSNNQHLPTRKQRVSVVPLKPKQLVEPGSRRMMPLDGKSSASNKTFDGQPNVRQSATCSPLGKGAPAKVKCEGEQEISSNLSLKESSLNLNKKLESKSKEGQGPKDLPDVKRSWFAEPPWKVKMEKAFNEGSVVVLDNLDINLSATQIEEAIEMVFRQKCTVRLIEQSIFTNPHHGRALVIFKSSDAANDVVQRLRSEAKLFLLNGKPLLARKGFTTPLEKTSSLRGLLSVEKLGNLRKRPEQRSAVSGSHYSQANTIEYEMAMEWMLLDYKCRCFWEQLHQENELEMKETNADLRNNDLHLQLPGVGDESAKWG